MDCEKNAKNLHFWVKNGKFGQFLAKMGETGFFQKRAWKIFPPLQALTNCKDSEKSNGGIPRKRIANGRTDEG